MSSASLDLLFVDDDDELRQGFANYFFQLGHHVDQAESAEIALEKLQNHAFDVVLLDMVMSGMTGIELLEKLRADSAETQVVLLTGEGTVEKAVHAMKMGAYDFLTKPTKLSQLEAVIGKAAEAGRMRNENRRLRTLIERNAPKGSMVGESAAMEEVFRLIARVAPSDKPILIQGESGTGKELVARALHEASSRASHPLVVVNCAALPEQLLESELFGHEKGAFTGAANTKPGLFEVADGGTLFIDEIGELAPALQPKLLRVLEDGSLRRVGSLKERRVDVRIIAATNRDMATEVAEKRFREDLYYRINVMSFVLPPLRERGDDVLLLANHFAGHGWEFGPEFCKILTEFSWPGNVRQLINAIDRAKLLADDEILRQENLPPEVLNAPHSLQSAAVRSDADLASLTRARVVQALQEENGNKLQSAKTLGVSRRSLYRLIEKYNIKPSELHSESH
ncbi:sigma-54-dependent transcriptional regulator [Adhaeretor mobilis]|uniref:Transcriptional regulatory protein ZraR n=1 Tax=Adhaeretor mobilis TaxID=1930276 RepID=A0A517MZD8_9BACT|nr:sigma-54 dependent transcriptional regulator [Adhaeretor mobilis]QDT00256.1 Transcriptional regulatory protein ZraR [Adhaeretor mobilis]